MDLRGVVDASERTRAMTKALRPGELVQLDLSDALEGASTRALFMTELTRSGHRVAIKRVAVVEREDLGIVIQAMKLNEERSIDPNVLVIFGRRLGWISEHWLKPAGTKT